MTVKIVTDSTCDLPEEVISDLGITVVPLYINIGDKSYLDKIEITREEFYTNLPNYKTHPTTATPGVNKFINVYSDLLRDGATSIISIHISPSLSAVLNVAQSAVQQMHPAPIIAIDSMQLSMGTGFIVKLAAEIAIKGGTVDKIKAAINHLIPRTHVFAALDTLEYLRRSGRMNGAVAGIGSLLQVKPILKMNNGEPTSERVRTQERAIARVVELLKNLLPIEQIALVHTHAEHKARKLLEASKQYLSQKDIPTIDITPVIGVHLGPGAVGFACVSQNR
jgi:DegV family protein with EDD domain